MNCRIFRGWRLAEGGNVISSNRDECALELQIEPVEPILRGHLAFSIVDGDMRIGPALEIG